MKFLKMTIRRRKIENRTRYDYPSSYDATKVKVGPIYESGLEAQAQVARNRGKDDEYILLGVANGDLAQFLEANGSEKDGFVYGAEEIDLATIKSIGDTYTAQTTKITDENKVIQICAKAVLGRTLTSEEKDALDPKKDTPGVVETKKFSEGLDDLVARIEK